jgi:translation initiation factor 1
MSKKIANSFSGLVYSTNPQVVINEPTNNEVDTLAAAKQHLRVRLDTKHRAGKAVTLVTGFVGTLADIETLGKSLKSFCGTGGSIKENEIIVQGDNRDKILVWLIKNGYSLSKKI